MKGTVKDTFGLSGSALKVLALVSMTVDHTALMFCDGSLKDMLRLLGRLAFPIFAFLLVEGYRHTRSFRRYLLALILFAVLSQVPHNLMMTDCWKDIHALNILFTLSLGLVAMKVLDLPRERTVLKFGALLLIAPLSLLCEYGIGGVGLVLLLRYMWPVSREASVLVGIPLMGAEWKSVLGLLPLYLYDGSRGFLERSSRWTKYVFYAYYPLHMLVLCLIRSLL